MRWRMRAPSMAAVASLAALEEDVLRALPERHFAERRKLIGAFNDGEKMIAGELPHFAGKAHAAIGEENLGLADAAGIKDDLAGRGEARMVLVAEAEIEIAQRNPTSLAAPAHMNDALAIGQEARELGAGLGRRGAFETRAEAKGAGGDAEIVVHDFALARLSRQACMPSAASNAASAAAFASSLMKEASQPLRATPTISCSSSRSASPIAR